MISKLSAHLGPTSLFLGGSAPSLVLYLDAGNTFSYTGTGSTWYDLTSLNNDISLTNTTYNATYSNLTKFEGSFEFNGTSSFGSLISGTAIPLMNSHYTIESWIQADSIGSLDSISGQTKYYIQLLDANNSNTIMFTGFFYVDDTTHIVQTFYDSTNPTVDIRSTGGNGGPTYLYYSGWFCFDGGGCNITSFPYLYGASTGDYNLYGDANSSTGNVDGYSNVTYEFSLTSFESVENGGIIGWGNYGSASETNVLVQNGTEFSNYWGESGLTVSATFSTDYWYHLAATYDGTNRTIYLNGQSLGTDIPGVSHSVPSFSNLTIGVANTTEFFNGRISTIKVWNKNLNSTQLLNAFNSNKSKYGYDFGSITFNDTDSYLISTSNDYVLGTNDFTVEAFFNAATSSHNYAGIISQRQVGNYNVSINLQSANTSEPLIEFCSGTVYSTYTASNDEWYHVAISRTSGTSSYFINGNLVNEVTDTTDYTPSDLVVGRYYTEFSDYYFNGVISNVRVLNGTGLYTGTFSIPSVQLSGTYSNTKFLITSQEINPSKDMTGLHSVTASNIGWTSSLPSFYQYYYEDFSSTTGLELVSIYQITGNQIYLTSLANSDVGNVYTSTAIRYDRSFSLQFNFSCSDGDGADGFCVQWTTTNNLVGVQGGNVGTILDSSTINALQFKTYNSSVVYFKHNDIEQTYENASIVLRQNVYYWIDYNYGTSTMTIYYSTTNTKPGSAQHTFTGVTFDSGNYYLGFGAATGGSTDYHVLKSMNLTFQS